MPAATGLILVFDAESGLTAMLADVVKKALGREDCALCEITYSPLGKRRAWQACEARLGMPVRELHRDNLPAAWGLDLAQLPCVLVQTGEAKPEMLLTKTEVTACAGRVDELERKLRETLAARAVD
jgi:hypothetical protein